MKLTKFENLTCCNCGFPIHDGIGNNGEPFIDGRVCEKCNYQYVLPLRLLLRRKYMEGR